MVEIWHVEGWSKDVAYARNTESGCKSLSDSSGKQFAIFYQRSWLQLRTHEQYVICSKTHLDGTTLDQTIICRQLFSGHEVGFRPTKRKKKYIE